MQADAILGHADGDAAAALRDLLFSDLSHSSGMQQGRAG